MKSAVVAGVLGGLVVAVGYLVHATAITTPIVLERKPSQRLRIAYVTFVGPYHEAYKKGQVVEAELAKIAPRNWADTPCIGIYYDNPKEVPAERCRSVFGKIIPEDMDVAGLEGVRVDVIEAMEDTIQIRYPLRGFLSIMAGIFRAYPAINKFWASQASSDGTAIAELYGFGGNYITYLQGVGKYEGIMMAFPE